MTDWINRGARLLLLWAVLSALFVGQVRADDNLPPVPPGGAPLHAPVTYPYQLLEPSPTGRMGRMGLTDTPLEVVEAPVLTMKVLVVLDSRILVEDPANPGTNIEVGDGVSQMITGYLDILGIPYDTLDVDGRLEGSAPVITEEMLWDGVDHGHYYAVFVGTNTTWWPADPADADDLHEGLTEDERNLIRAYERTFGVRRVTWYAFPEASQYGLTHVGGTTAPVTATLTAAGDAVFTYLRPGLSVALTGGYTHLAVPANGATFTPLIVDDANHSIMGIYEPTDAGEHLVVTASAYYPATPPVSIHARLWPYGIINWATKGVFLGERRLYFVPQPDDILSFGDRWDPISRTVIYDDGFRLTAADMDNLIAWMDAFTNDVPNAADFKIEMPFNGEGVLLDLDENGNIAPDSLTDRVVDLQDRFVWLNHTYSHADLDGADVALATTEILSNTEVAEVLGFTDYVTTTLLTGAYSGLQNYNLISTADSLGIGYVLANASQPGYNNPTPNTGLTPYPAQPDLLLVPRLANNIFYFASTPEQETDYYNSVYDEINGVYYCEGYFLNPVPGNLCYPYEKLLDLVTNQALGFLLDFNVNATMFHMNNLDAYDAPTSTKTLLGDYVESLYGKYNTYYNDNVPILSLRTQEIGERMWDRMDYNAAGVSGIIACTNDITLTVPLTAPTTVKVPITGILYAGENAETETYAGQDISTITMQQGETRLVSAADEAGDATATTPAVPTAVTGLELTENGDGTRMLSWNPVAESFGYRVYRGSSPQTLVEIAVVGETAYTDAEITGDTVYAVTAIADDCWKQESAQTIVQLSPTSVTLTSLRATPGAAALVTPLLAALSVTVALVFVSRRRRGYTRS